MRVFKTKWLARASRKARISDAALYGAACAATRGQADDLGGGVFKKRLNENRHRSIVLAKGGERWVFVYLFAKKDRANIDDDELADFRTLADGYAVLSDSKMEVLLQSGEVVEISDGHG